MNIKYRPYGIYSYDQSKDKNDGVWRRVRSFNSMSSAMQSLQALTKQKKEDRRYCYVILPNKDRRKYIIIMEEHREQILKSAR